MFRIVYKHGARRLPKSGLENFADAEQDTAHMYLLTRAKAQQGLSMGALARDDLSLRYYPLLLTRRLAFYLP